MSFAPFEAADEALLLRAPAEGASQRPPERHQEDAISHQGATSQCYGVSCKSIGSQRGIKRDTGPSDREEKAEDVDTTCAVCLEEYEDPVVVATAHCTHTFCKKCITCWLSLTRPSAQCPSCPLCKRPVTWLLSLSASSPPVPPFRYVLLAVGPDMELLERQPWPSPALLQASRQKQLDLFEARERRRRGREGETGRGEQEKGAKSEKRSNVDAGAGRGVKRRYEPGTNLGRGGNMSESLREELHRVNREIEGLRRRM